MVFYNLKEMNKLMQKLDACYITVTDPTSKSAELFFQHYTLRFQNQVQMDTDVDWKEPITSNW